jgi:hypothetical protein
MSRRRQEIGDVTVGDQTLLSWLPPAAPFNLARVPDDATRSRILVDNACTLYGFPVPAQRRTA